MGEEKDKSREAKRFYSWPRCPEKNLSICSLTSPFFSLTTLLLRHYAHHISFCFFAALPYTRLHFSSSGSKAAIFNLNRLAAHLAPLNHGPRKQSVCIAPAAVFCLIYFHTRLSSMIWEWPSLPYSLVCGEITIDLVRVQRYFSPI